MDQYMDFIRQIPDDVFRATETHIGSNIALFKPRSYLTGVALIANDYHIMLPSDNAPDTMFNKKHIQIDKRKILAVNPGDTAVCTKSIPTQPYCSILIKPDLLTRIAEEMGFFVELRFLNIQNSYSGELLQAIRSFDKEAGRTDRLQLMLDCLETQIATLLLREFKTNITRISPHCPDQDSYARIAMEYMRTYFAANITLEDICDEIHLSPYHFIRIFKQKTGISPHRYLLNLRIRKAEEFLRSSRYSVSETAVLCGFVSIPHFSATFKAITGYSPSDYKRR